jgi:hypothetical protein
MAACGLHRDDPTNELHTEAMQRGGKSNEGLPRTRLSPSEGLAVCKQQATQRNPSPTRGNKGMRLPAQHTRRGTHKENTIHDL